MIKEARQLIDGQWLAGGVHVDSINPADGRVIGRYADGELADGEAAIAAAKRAFERPDWAQAPRLRQQVMLHWADGLERKAEQLAQLLTRENGKVLAQSRAEIGGAISEIRYYAGLARYIPGHVFEVAPGEYSTLLKEHPLERTGRFADPRTDTGAGRWLYCGRQAGAADGLDHSGRDRRVARSSGHAQGCGQPGH